MQRDDKRIQCSSWVANESNMKSFWSSRSCGRSSIFSFAFCSVFSWVWYNLRVPHSDCRKNIIVLVESAFFVQFCPLSPVNCARCLYALSFFFFSRALSVPAPAKQFCEKANTATSRTLHNWWVQRSINYRKWLWYSIDTTNSAQFHLKL